MHNALRWFLLWTLFPFVIVAADPPPPLTRSVLTTNIPPFGSVGQALFRTANLPYLDWSNIVHQVIDTNAFQPASANLTNWSLISTNALTGKLDSNVWWAAWGSLSTNALTGKLDSNYWFTVWGAIATNALTAKLDSNWWWTAYGSKMLTNSGAFIASASGVGTNTTFYSNSSPGITVYGDIQVKDQKALSVGNSGSSFNLMMGNLSGNTLASGIRNILIGYATAPAMTNGNYNVCLGYSSGGGMVNQDGNTFLGYAAGATTTTNNQVMVGFGAGLNTTTGNKNTMVGYNAGAANTTGYGHTIIGANAGLLNTTGLEQTFIGVTAGPKNTTGNSDVFIGPNSGHSNTNGSVNTYVGLHSGYSYEGDGNVAIGAYAGSDEQEWTKLANYNVLLGYYSGTNLTSGSSNIMIGPWAMSPFPSSSGQINIGNVLYGSMQIGKMGIGTTNPQAIFDIQGTNDGNGFMWRVGSKNLSGSGSTNAANVTTNGDFTCVAGVSGQYLVASSGSVFTGFGLVNSSSANNASYGSTASGPNITRNVADSNPALIVNQVNTGSAGDILQLKYGGVTKVTVNSNGWTGIGTSAPSARLHVTADNTAPNVLQVDTTNRHDLMVVNTNGHVGIGTNNPQAVLHVTGTNGPSQYIVQVENPMKANGTNAFSVGTNGNVWVGGTTLSIQDPNNAGPSTVWAVSSGNQGGLIQIGDTGVVRGGISYNFNVANCLEIYSGAFNAAGARLFVMNTGLIGVGTNSPQARMDVIGDNSVSYVLRAGTTNRPTLLTLSTNGVLTDNPGNTGNGPIILGAFGNLKMSDTNIIVCPGADVYTNACGTNFTSITTNGFYGCLGPGDAAALTNLYAGYYSVQAFMSYTGANGTSYEVGVFTNLVECTELEWKDTFDTPARARGNSLGGVIYLPAGCRTSLKIKDYGTGSSVAVTRVSLKIGTP